MLPDIRTVPDDEIIPLWMGIIESDCNIVEHHYDKDDSIWYINVKTPKFNIHIEGKGAGSIRIPISSMKFEIRSHKFPDNVRFDGYTEDSIIINHINKKFLKNHKGSRISDFVDLGPVPSKPREYTGPHEKKPFWMKWSWKF